LHPIGCIISVDDRDSWSWELHGRMWRSIDLGGVLLAHLLFFIGVAEDDDVAIIGRPKKTAGKVAEELPREFFILRGVREEIFLVRR
jgi:hypothetical protein